MQGCSERESSSNSIRPRLRPKRLPLPLKPAAPPAPVKTAAPAAPPPSAEKPAVVVPKPAAPAAERSVVVTPPVVKPVAPAVVAPPPVEKPAAPPAVVVTPPAHPPAVVVTPPAAAAKNPCNASSGSSESRRLLRLRLPTKPVPGQPIVQQRRMITPQTGPRPVYTAPPPRAVAPSAPQGRRRCKALREHGPCRVRVVRDSVRKA